MGLGNGIIPGQTPLGEEETFGLLIPSITSKKELDESEQMNIESAIQWTLKTRIGKDDLLTEWFVKRVHLEMFGHVRNWAGEFRKTEKNIGVMPYLIPIELKTLLDDCAYWVTHEAFTPDEIAMRFKHRLVSIHCFPNGNGRHSRLMADLIIEKLFNKPPFTWQGSRENYVKAIKVADLGNMTPLLEFARS